MGQDDVGTSAAHPYPCCTSEQELIEGDLTESVIGAFYEVYNTLGYRYLEQVYLAALERELRARGHAVGREVWVPVHYKGEVISRQRLFRSAYCCTSGRTPRFVDSSTCSSTSPHRVLDRALPIVAAVAVVFALASARSAASAQALRS